MSNKLTKIHLEIQTSSKSPVGILRSSYRDSNKKTQHKQYGRITGKTLNELKLLRLAFQGKVIDGSSSNAFQILESKEYGASASILQIIKDTGLDKDIYPKPEQQWVKNVTAMMVGRIIYQGSKLSLCNLYENSSLWQQAGIDDRPDVKKDCYSALDELLSRQNLIQKKLAKKHLKDGHLVLYDITSSYLEGEYKDSKLVKSGYNRDGKKGHEQIVIGLLCSKEGCPVGIEVYPGNTKDETTVIDKIKEIKEKYKIKKAIFVGDRGMVTSSNIEKLKNEKDIATISAITRNEIFELLKNNTIQPSLFDEHNIHEVIDPQNSNKRYCLCKNPLSEQDSKNTREKLISLTVKELDKIKNYKRSTKVEILGSRIGKVLQKYKMGKYINWEIKADIAGKNKGKSSGKKGYSLHAMFKYEEKRVKKYLQECSLVIVKPEESKGSSVRGNNRIFYFDSNKELIEFKDDSSKKLNKHRETLDKLKAFDIRSEKRFQCGDFDLKTSDLEKFTSYLGCARKKDENEENNSSSPNHQIIYSLNPKTIKKAELLDGCYIISSNNVSSNIMDANQIVASYKKLELVETAFRNLKTTSIEVRPVYHKTDKRIKAHVFLCMLSYYVQWHMQQRLKPLFDNDKGENRRWCFTGIIETLKQVTKNKTSSNGIEFYQNSLLTKTQKEIINYLNIKI